MKQCHCESPYCHDFAPWEEGGALSVLAPCFFVFQIFSNKILTLLLI